MNDMAGANSRNLDNTLGRPDIGPRDIEQRAFGYIREAVPLQQLQRFLPRS